MKRKLLLFSFLLINFFSYSQQYNYQVKITDFNYWYKAKSGLCGDAKHITLSITFEDNTTNILYKTSNIRKINETDFIDRFFVKKPKSIHISSFIHEEDNVGWCNGYTAKVTKDTGSLNYIDGAVSGSLSGYDNGGNQAIIDVKFNYEVLKVEKNYNYKIEYEIDLHSKSLERFIEFDVYSGGYNVTLKTDMESKIVYSDYITGSKNTALTIQNTKYDSIVRFKDPLNTNQGKMDIRFRSDSEFKCMEETEDPRFRYINSVLNTNINEINGCLSHKYLFNMCNTIEVKYFNLYRIYAKLGDIELNKPNFGPNGISPELKDCEPFRVYVNDCNEESSYAVEYSVGGNFKTYLPYARRESYFDLDYNKLEGVKVGGNISLRIKYYNSGNYLNNPYLYSDLVNFTIFGCSPKLTQEPTPIKTTCSYSKDGRVKVTFNRQLNNEKLFLSVRFREIGTTTYHLYSQEDTTTLQDNLNGTYSYTWKGTYLYLEPGNEYKIKYQTLSIDSELDDKDPSWKTAEENEKLFLIPTATNVQFNAQKLNDENCFNSGDGKIRIFNVSGGTGEGYEYELNENNKWILFNPSNIKANEVIIGGRGKGTHKVKVRDSKKCMAK